MLGEMAGDKAYVKRALETSINVGLVFLLVTLCFLILRPFILLIAWGIIIAVAAYPAFQRLRHLLREHGTFAAVLFTLILLAVLILPIRLVGSEPASGNPGRYGPPEGWNCIYPPAAPGCRKLADYRPSLARDMELGIKGHQRVMIADLLPKSSPLSPGYCPPRLELVSPCCNSCSPSSFPDYSWQTPSRSRRDTLAVRPPFRR